jgi:hypothetical protein
MIKYKKFIDLKKNYLLCLTTSNKCNKTYLSNFFLEQKIDIASSKLSAEIVDIVSPLLSVKEYLFIINVYYKYGKN